jgi:hypothetical protein
MIDQKKKKKKKKKNKLSKNLFYTCIHEKESQSTRTHIAIDLLATLGVIDFPYHIESIHYSKGYIKYILNIIIHI